MVVENQHLFAEILNNLMMYDEESIFLSDNYQIINLKKEMFIIENILNFEINNKKYINQLYNYIDKSNSNQNMAQKLAAVNVLLSEIIADVKLDTNITLDYKEVINLIDILQMFDIKVDLDNTDLIHKLLIYIKFIGLIYNPKVIIIPFLDSFLTPQEILTLIQEVSLLEICIFILSPYDKSLLNVKVNYKSKCNK